MIFDRLNSQSIKCQKFTPSGCKDIAIEKFEFVAKTQFFAMSAIYFNYIVCKNIRRNEVNFWKYKYLESFQGLDIQSNLNILNILEVWIEKFLEASLSIPFKLI